MSRPRLAPLRALSALLCGVAIGWGGSIPAQEAEIPTSASASASRPLAPGVLQVIPPTIAPEETFDGPLQLDYVSKNPDLAWVAPTFPDNQPFYAPSSETLLEKGKEVVLRREVWGFEIGFKPVRMIAVDVPQSSGKLQRKLVWYMLYRVRYVGGDQRPEPVADEFGNPTFPKPASVSYKSRRFLPSFVLIEKPTNKEYLDRVVPAAKKVIEARERVGKPLYDTLEIQNLAINRSTDTENNEVWGIATWEDVDPRVDFFSVQVQGLTNAFEIKALEDGSKRYLRKTLQLNFWRPGDTIDELADKIRYGVPAVADPKRQVEILRKYGVSERLDYLWIYR